MLESSPDTGGIAGMTLWPQPCCGVREVILRKKLPLFGLQTQLKLINEGKVFLQNLLEGSYAKTVRKTIKSVFLLDFVQKGRWLKQNSKVLR